METALLDAKFEQELEAEMENIGKVAIYRNITLNEEYRLAGVSDIGKAWSLADFVCRRTGWNPEMFSWDVTVKMQGV